MIVEITKTGFVNKGANLMLLAILDKMKNKYPDAKFVVRATLSEKYIDRAKLGLYQKIQFRKFGITWDKFLFIIPKTVRDRIGLILDSEIDVVLNAAGFIYSDQWGANKAKSSVLDMQKWKKQDSVIILMPQAFGPFTIEQLKKDMRKIIELSDLIYARDKISYNYLTELSEDKNNIKLSPDFTNLLIGKIPENFSQSENKVCLVPNMRMIDKSQDGNDNKYLQLMSNSLKILHEMNAKPFFLIHEGKKDLELANKIMKKSGIQVNIINEKDALNIKGIIGTCDAMIGSRFHGLVNALSQGVPALGTGWSHKYQMLFEDYDFTDGLLSLDLSYNDLEKRIRKILEKETRDKVVEKIQRASKAQKEKVEKMWEEIFNKIDSKKK